MAKRDKFLARLFSGQADASIDFDRLCEMLQVLGFEETVRGSHHMFDKDGVDEQINLQREGRHAKPYQVRQVRKVLLKYALEGTE